MLIRVTEAEVREAVCWFLAKRGLNVEASSIYPRISEREDHPTELEGYEFEYVQPVPVPAPPPEKKGTVRER